MIAALVAVFIASGAAGLIYEAIWSRYLGLFVGHSAYAQIIVLVIFLGGMSLGAHLAGRWSRHLRSPLLWYAGVEMLVGLLSLVFHDAFAAVTARAYESVFPALGATTLTFVKWTIASALILPQSVLLGTTFPLMSAGVIRLARAEEMPGNLLGLMYFANSIGAAGGVLIAGFLLIEMVGLPGTLMVAGYLNILAALIVVLIARAHGRAVAREALNDTAAPLAGQASVFVESRERSGRHEGLRRLLLTVAFGTAVASFIYEIAWIRMLSLVLGSATHSFELMLSAFILGLALGALWIRSRVDHLTHPLRFLGGIQWVMGLLAVATLPLYVASFQWMGTILSTVQQNENGYRAFLVIRYLLALLIMLPSTFCAGMTLPLITRMLMRSGSGERAIGSVYAINTLGSIAGVILAGLVLMPVLGLKRLLVLGAVIDIGLGVWLWAVSSGLWGLGRAETDTADRRPARWRFASRTPLAIPVIATAILLALIAGAARFDLARLTSGVYRHGILAKGKEYEFPYYRDGRTATVSMRRSIDGFLTLATNGKPDASMTKVWTDSALYAKADREQLTQDLATQLLLPLVAIAHAAEARDVAVIGHGSGMSSHVLLGSPHVREVVTIEIEPEMIRASRLFRPGNSRVFDDPRSTFVIDDAKAYFAAARRQFDLILSEPSNPWVSGVSGLFTLEFYSRVKEQLTDGGVFGQWLHLYELSDGLVNTVLAAIDSVFPSYEIFFTSNADILVVAANRALPEPVWDVVSYPGIASDLRRVTPFARGMFEALRLGGRDVLHPMLSIHAAPNSDYFPILDLSAERMRFMRETAEGYTSLSTGRFDVVAALSNRRAPFSSVFVTPTPEVHRTSARALGARIRQLRRVPPGPVADLPRDEELRLALYDLDALDRVMAATRAPADWSAWMASVVRADAQLHGGTAGVVDADFFTRVRDFAAQNDAPEEVRAAIDFLRGIGSWNWTEATVAARRLMATPNSDAWIPNTLLRNGAAVAFIKLRDYDGAKDVLRWAATRTGNDKFRERLISSYLIFQDPAMRESMGH